MRYLVDTDWIISGLGGIQEALTLLTRMAQDGLAISVITEAEVLEGAYGQSDPVNAILRFRRFFQGYEILPVTSDVVAEFARLRSHLRRQGRRIEDFDLLIASTAIHHDLELVTRNRRHFERVPGLKLYDLDHT